MQLPIQREESGLFPGNSGDYFTGGEGGVGALSFGGDEEGV